MKNKVREEANVTSGYDSYEYFLEKLNDSYKHLKSIGCSDIEVRIDEEYGSQYICLVGYRLETDEEYESRLVRENTNKKNHLEGLKGSLKKLAKTDPEEYMKIFKDLEHGL